MRLCIFTIGLLPSAYRLLLQPQQCASAINIRPLAAAILVSSDLILLAREKISALRAQLFSVFFPFVSQLNGEN